MSKKITYTLKTIIIIVTFFLLLSLNYTIPESAIYSIIPFVNYYFLFKHTIGLPLLIVYFIIDIYVGIMWLYYHLYLDNKILLGCLGGIIVGFAILITAITKAIIIII